MDRSVIDVDQSYELFHTPNYNTATTRFGRQPVPCTNFVTVLPLLTEFVTPIENVLYLASPPLKRVHIIYKGCTCNWLGCIRNRSCMFSTFTTAAYTADLEHSIVMVQGTQSMKVMLPWNQRPVFARWSDEDASDPTMNQCHTCHHIWFVNKIQIETCTQIVSFREQV